MLLRCIQSEINKSVFFSDWMHLRSMGYNTALSYRNALKWPFNLAFNIITEVSEFALLAKSHFLANPPVQKIFSPGTSTRPFKIFGPRGEVKDLPREERFLA